MTGRRHGRVRGAVLTGAVSLALLTACSSAEEPAPSAEPTAAPSTVEVPNAEVLAEAPSRPADERSPAGAIRFATYVVETVMHAAAQNGHEAIRALDVAGDCTTCQQLAQALEEAEDAGERQTFAEPPRVFDVQVAERGRGEGTWIVIAPFERPAITEYDASGEPVEEYPATPRVMEMGIKWVDGAWQLFNYRYAEDGEEG
ncbi:hypothetical protein J2S59_000509 [Nocardioides massiliensis]|uniref:Lipoprotein n=1 Tax=Nocardioides massiliensis TaxID=1325935 RepID=A0ABT9NLK2_9ACTN|nr:hypothetical protein [Nocardioides massiliensis]MDP9820700.1 hypothetical protein [Nocardioides massiliensis]